ncbi:MAG: DUF4830 domain-containing protein [Ruminococcaceae bacterium]|nr:DUF4830 domain-containing protein [Oscillospiraceae bacterium]
MFVYSLRASTLKFFGVTTLAVVALVTLLVFIPTAEPAMSEGVLEVMEEVRFDKIKTAEDRLAFLAQFGWEVESTPVEEAEVTIPAEFDKVYQSYNELQKKQGFDLTKYHKKDVMRYTYRITNYPDYTGEVLVSILMHKNKVIGGDVCSSDAGGFIHGLDRTIS